MPQWHILGPPIPIQRGSLPKMNPKCTKYSRLPMTLNTHTASPWPGLRLFFKFHLISWHSLPASSTFVFSPNLIDRSKSTCCKQDCWSEQIEQLMVCVGEVRVDLGFRVWQICILWNLRVLGQVTGFSTLCFLICTSEVKRMTTPSPSPMHPLTAPPALCPLIPLTCFRCLPPEGGGYSLLSHQTSTWQNASLLLQWGLTTCQVKFNNFISSNLHSNWISPVSISTL